MIELGCRCTSDRDGPKRTWSRGPDGTWLHDCGLPSEATIKGQNMLNLFRGGTHHNELVETEDLVKDSRYGWVAGYAWSPEKIVGSVSGREARVWVYKEPVQAS